VRVGCGSERNGAANAPPPLLQEIEALTPSNEIKEPATRSFYAALRLLSVEWAVLMIGSHGIALRPA